MLKVLLCIRTEYNGWLVVLAAVVCVAATQAIFYLYSKVPAFPTWRRWRWLAMTGLVAGSGIWTTHFVAMLAFETGLPTGYAVLPTAASFIVAVVGSMAGFALASGKGNGLRGPLRAVIGGLIVGLGITIMHYLGMSGYRTTGYLRWDGGYVLASISIGAALACPALLISPPGTGWRRRCLAGAMLAAAIVGMHFTGMAAVTIVPDPSVVVPLAFIPNAVLLAIAVAGAAIITLTAIGGVAFDVATHNGGLRRLRQALDVIPDGLAFYDASDRLVAWNAQYEELCQPVGAPLSAGMSYTDILQSNIAHGAYPDAEGRESEWIAERKAAHRGDIDSLIERTAAGRWLRITDRRANDGSTVSVSVDITDLKAAERVITEARDRAEKMASRAEAAETVAGLGHWRMDVRTQEVAWSQQMYVIYGLDPQQPLDLPNLLNMKHEQDRTRATERMTLLMEGAEVPEEWVDRIVRADGEIRHCASKSGVERDAEGIVTHVFGTVVDVTKQKLLESKLRHAQAEAEAAAAVKSDFLANMSHELRTPLTSIIGFANLTATQPDLSPLSRTYVDRVRDASQALQGTVNDILDFSKLEAGQLSIKPQPTSVTNLCRATLELFTPQAGAKDLQIVCDDEGVEELVLAVDPDRIRQILLNLVGNGVKFTECGEVRLRTRYDAAGGMLTIEVLDTGAGIPADKQNRLFQRFSQIDGSLTRTGGTGLGLAICKALVELMGGEIGVESAPGAGSRFWFSIPAALAEIIEKPGSPADIRSFSGIGVRILLVDDHPANRKIAGMFLAGIGAEVTEAADGEEAVQRALEWPFDVILMDIRMPRLDGPGALRRIRQTPGLNDQTPILAFTADAGADADGDQAQAMAAMGFQGVVSKPVDAAKLIAAVAEAALGQRPLLENDRSVG